MLKFTIKSTALVERSVPTKKGTLWVFKEQDAWGEVNGEYRRMKFRAKRTPLGDGKFREDPYPVGEYTLSDASFEVNQHGALELGFNVELVPIAAAVSKVG